MPDATPILDIPYPLPADDVRDYPATGQALAELLEDLLLPIADVELGASAASFDFSSIPSTYKHLYLRASLRGTAAATSIGAGVQFNGDTSGNYARQYRQTAAAATSSAEAFAQSSISFPTILGDSGMGSSFSQVEMWIANYKSATPVKLLRALYASVISLNTGDFRIGELAGEWNSAAALNRIVIAPSSGSWKTGSRVSLYGLL